MLDRPAERRRKGSKRSFGLIFQRTSNDQSRIIRMKRISCLRKRNERRRRFYRIDEFDKPFRGVVDEVDRFLDEVVQLPRKRFLQKISTILLVYSCSQLD